MSSGLSLNSPALIARVYAYVAYRVGPGPEAEDLTSDVFERALRYQDSFDPRRGDVVAWLVGIARRCIADQHARRAADVLTSDHIVDSHESASLRSIELAAAVGALPERDREIIALRFGADLSAREIAAVLELRTNTVEVALHRALARLRGELDAPSARAANAVAAPTADATLS